MGFPRICILFRGFKRALLGWRTPRSSLLRAKASALMKAAHTNSEILKCKHAVRGLPCRRRRCRRLGRGAGLQRRGRTRRPWSWHDRNICGRVFFEPHKSVDDAARGGRALYDTVDAYLAMDRGRGVFFEHGDSRHEQQHRDDEAFQNVTHSTTHGGANTWHLERLGTASGLTRGGARR